MKRAQLFVLLTLAVSVISAGAAPLGPGLPQADPNQFFLTGHHQFRLAGELVKDAQIYKVLSGQPRIVVIAPGLAQPILFSAADKQVIPIAKERLIFRPDDPESFTLQPVESFAKGERLVVDGLNLKSQVEGKPILIESRDPLVGETAPEGILAYMPEYRRAAAAFQPGKGDLKLLASLTEPADIEVFFGIWCPHCEKMIPRLLKVVESLKNPNIRFHFHGLPQIFSEDPLPRQYKVIGVPVAIVRRGEKILGRIDGPKLEHPETALSSLLFGDEPANSTAQGQR